MTKQSGIVRLPDFAGGGLTDEEREKMAAHAALWIERALRTKPADPATIEDVIKGLYRAENLAEPRVILVPSPFVMAMAGGIAAVWWFLRDKKLPDKKMAATETATSATIIAAIKAATDDATSDATYAVTAVVTDVEIYAATEYATLAASDEATYDATVAATDEATEAATVTLTATTAATNDATKAATGKDWRALAAHFVGEDWAQAALDVIKNWRSVCQEGNMKVFWDCYLTAARDILGLRLDPHAAYAHWEQAAIHGGFRWMHPKFCLVSDFPEILRVNTQNRPHAEFGPSHRWRDGLSIWHLNGVSVEQWMAENHPDEMDARKVLRIRNVDQRRECIRRMGMERIVGQLEPKVLDVELREVGGEYRLLAVDMNHGEPWRFLQMVNQSIGAVHIEAVPRECSTVREALNWRRSQNINQDWFPIQLT
ncbi:MAG TPA: hypothetical protein VFY40_20940 [Blastocatellia bacterium]|nr:hypothetical protein [Blastocatellia bacterium]